VRESSLFSQTGPAQSIILIFHARGTEKAEGQAQRSASQLQVQVGVGGGGGPSPAIAGQK
jgi:hypothetical protein